MSLRPKQTPEHGNDSFGVVKLPAYQSCQYKHGELIKLNSHMLGYLCRPTPQHEGQRFNSLLILGGSEGGIPEATVEFWAQQGYLSLGVAYHRGLSRWGSFAWTEVPGELTSGIPDYLERIELTGFEDALRILEADGASTGNLATIGVSRGGELSLILGAVYKQRIRAVVALVPSAAVVLAHSWDNPTYSGFQANRTPAWHLSGIPYRGDLSTEAFVTADTLGRIPVENIPAPLFLISGGRDAVWHPQFVESCPHIVNAERIAHQRSNLSDVAVHYPDAGHYFPLPHHLANLSEENLQFAGGTSLEAVREASLDAHTRLTEFLRKHLPSMAQTP
jgi:pimeloyl-ACP methyl ester carboxylesterase